MENSVVLSVFTAQRNHHLCHSPTFPSPQKESTHLLGKCSWVPSQALWPTNLHSLCGPAYSEYSTWRVKLFTWPVPLTELRAHPGCSISQHTVPSYDWITQGRTSIPQLTAPLVGWWTLSCIPGQPCEQCCGGPVWLCVSSSVWTSRPENRVVGSHFTFVGVTNPNFSMTFANTCYLPGFSFTGILVDIQVSRHGIDLYPVTIFQV